MHGTRTPQQLQKPIVKQLPGGFCIFATGQPRLLPVKKYGWATMITRLMTGTLLAAVLLLSMVACTTEAATPTFDALSYNQTKWASFTPTPVPTPWLVEDLLDCDTTTLDRQVRGEQTGELLSDCEVAVTVAQLKTAGALERLPPDEKSYVRDIMENMDRIAVQMQRITEDGVIDDIEVGFLCIAVPQWEVHPNRIREWVEDKDAAEWQGLTLRAARFEMLAREVRPLC